MFSMWTFLEKFNFLSFYPSMKPTKLEKIKKDKSDRATVDKVLDKKTLSILERLLIRGKIFDLQGSICTGKEANVYLASASTELYSKYIKNIHILDSKLEDNVYKAKKFQELLNQELSGSNENLNNMMDEYFKDKSVITKSDNLEEVGEKKKSRRKKFKDFTNFRFLSLLKDLEDKQNIEIQAKEIEKKIIEESNGVLKEEEVIPVAIKIYKTSTMMFKDREKYIESEKRFTRFCTSNSRKLIKLWAEKEVRNLKRLNKAGIPSPKPIYLKSNILIMNLIGDMEDVAPRLKDADLHDKNDCYIQCINIIDDMYNKAGLIHSDFSEYNLLYKDRTVYVIDVGQSVETSHVNANYFLIMDIQNINGFFKKIDVEVSNLNEIFEKITGKIIPSYLRDIDVTKNTFIPSNLNEVVNIEDVDIFKKPEDECYDDEENSSENLDLSSDGLDNEVTEKKMVKDHLTKKEKKLLVKEFNRERRAVKLPKKEKKKIFKRYLGKKKR